VIDFTWVWSGPMVGAMLGDLGAEVIKIEHPGRLDNARLRGRPLKNGEPVEGPVEEISPYFHENNRNKLSVSLNLKDATDAEVLRRLIDSSDVLLDNYTPGALDRAGFGYAALSATNPALVMLSMSAAGKTGPLSAIRGYAPIMSALSGLESLVGYDDDPTIGMMTFGLGDPNAAAHAVLAVLGALARRELTGAGAFIDLSQADALVSVLGEALVQAQLAAGAPAGARAGDPAARSMRHPDYCPHGHYPCRGDDSWIAIAVGSDAEWQRCSRVLAGESLPAAARFATEAGRHRYVAELDAWLSAATRGRERGELVRALQQAEIAVAPVLDYAGMRTDAHLVARGAFREVTHPLTGPELLTALPWHLAGTPTTLRRSAPLVGQHTAEVLTRVLGFSADEVEQLAKAAR
jgi:crotonobetainyl-CoA:carnitine CoA-transferase CaiB-like acyl-CoA transferase